MEEVQLVVGLKNLHCSRRLVKKIVHSAKDEDENAIYPVMEGGHHERRWWYYLL